MTKRDEVALVKRLKKKEMKANSDLMAAYGGKIYNTALSMVKNREDAEDILQETFFKVFQKIDTFREEASLLTWIYRIALNFCYLRLRKNGRRYYLPFDEYLPKFDDQGSHLSPIANWGVKAEDELIKEELLKFLKESIESLPEKYRTVLVLKDIEGLSSNEIAESTSLTLPAVKSRLHRARLALRGMISACYEERAGAPVAGKNIFHAMPVLA